MSEGTVSYPYIMTLDDGRSVVVDRLPSADGAERFVAYELGPIDWATTVLLNPSVAEKMGDAMARLLEKFKKKAT
jgi:hypothetical protein